VSPSPAERERRTRALHGIISELDLDVLLLAGADYRGHKGALRWTADYNLAHRYGLVVVPPAASPELLLPQNLAMGRPGGWDVPVTYARDLRVGIPERLRELGTLRRIGIVGLGQVMKVEDYAALRDAFADAEIVDAQDAFEQARAHKSPEEHAGLREAARIADSCLERLLEIARPGVTERHLGAAMYGRCHELGGDDTLFLCMTAVAGADGRVAGTFGPPADRLLEPGDLHIFSFELTGPSGYWVELARMIVFGQPGDVQLAMHAAVAAGLEAGRVEMRPGQRPDQVQRAILDAVASHGARTTYWSGHGIGQDVLEQPWLGLDVVQDADVPSGWTLAEGMALSTHPYVTDLDERAIGYMADTYIVRDDGGEVLSQCGLELYVIE
jgi:Xaa-Pro aminopeptidase